MAQTPKVWASKQAYAYAGKNSISKFLVKRKLPVPTPFKKRGRWRPKQMRGRKNNKPPTIYVYGYSGGGDHHKV